MNSQSESSVSAKNLEIRNEFDGNLRNFGKRFWNYLSEEVEGLSNCLNSEEVSTTSLFIRIAICNRQPTY